MPNHPQESPLFSYPMTRSTYHMPVCKEHSISRPNWSTWWKTFPPVLDHGIPKSQRQIAMPPSTKSPKTIIATKIAAAQPISRRPAQRSHSHLLHIFCNLPTFSDIIHLSLSLWLRPAPWGLNSPWYWRYLYAVYNVALLHRLTSVLSIRSCRSDFALPIA